MSRRADRRRRACAGRTLLGLLVALALPAAATPAGAGPPTRLPGTLVVGLRPSAPRFQTGRVTNGLVPAPRGLEVDLARALAGSLGLSAAFRYVPHASGFLSPGPKPWDIALGQITAEKPQTVPYLRVPLGVLERRSLDESLQSAGDLRWVELCARRGSAAARVVEASIRPIRRPLLVGTADRELRLLAARKCDAVVDDAARLAAARAVTRGRYGALTALPGHDSRYAVALPAGSPLTPFVRRALRSLSQRRLVHRLSAKWLGVDLQRLPRLRRAHGPTTVTLIGDSVAASVGFVPGARSLLEDGLDLRLEALSCRRLAAPSCGRPPPPTAMQTILSDGRALGQVVVMDIGYNDSAATYGSELDTAMRDMLRSGVRHVVWVTLRERYSNYHSTNTVILAASRRWPELTVADWDAYSRGKPWFAPDGIHLNATGALALARFLHGFLVPGPGPAPGP